MFKINRLEGTGVKKLIHGLLRALKWLVIAAVLLEVFFFLVITASNYWIYGQVRDGDPIRYDPYALFVGENGPRPTAHNPGPGEAIPGSILWLFGGSTMNGETDQDEKTIPSFLAAVLNQEEPRLPTAVVNFGEPGYNSLMESKYLQKAFIEYSPLPQVIIFYDGANDCAYFAQLRTADAHHGYRRLQGLVESYHHSFFGLLKSLNAALYASFTREFYDKLRQGLIPLEPESPALRQMVAATEKRYDYLNKVAAAFGARFLLFWQPCWWVETGQVAAAVRDREDIVVGRHFALMQNFKVTNEALVASLKGKPYFIDFRNVLCSRTEPVYQRDGIHLQDAGRELVARRMGAVLKERLAGAAAPGGSY
jgi:lysophospholipase L1-like esterase